MIIIHHNLLLLIIRHHPNLDHREEAVSILLVAVASVKPDQEKVEGVAKLVTVPAPDLRGRSSLNAIFEREQLLLKEEMRTGFNIGGCQLDMYDCHLLESRLAHLSPFFSLIWIGSCSYVTCSVTTPAS